jgi:hypothetical protein
VEFVTGTTPDNQTGTATGTPIGNPRLKKRSI